MTPLEELFKKIEAEEKFKPFKAQPINKIILQVEHRLLISCCLKD